MSKKIKFVARSDWDYEVQPRPIPAYKLVPDWFRQATPYIPTSQDPTGTRPTFVNEIPAFNFKKCTPMLDALVTGYVITVPVDTYIEYIDNQPYIRTKTRKTYFENHNHRSVELDTPFGYSQQVVKFDNGWIPVTPKGYSVLVTSPFGYRNLPFLQVPAVIDSDKSFFEISLPLWVKFGNQEVPKGTPLAVIVPFKREAWEAEFSIYDGDYRAYEERTYGATMFNHYKKKIWSRKEYK